MAINKFVKAALGGGVIEEYGDAKQTRDFTYISDAVQANLQAAQSDVKGESFNIGGGSRISVIELVKLIRDVVGKDVQVKHIEAQKGDVRDTYADTTKARKLIGYVPEVGIKDGVKKYVDSFKT